MLLAVEVYCTISSVVVSSLAHLAFNSCENVRNEKNIYLQQ